MKAVRTGGGDTATNFFVLGLVILLGIPHLIPAFYRTITQPEEKAAGNDQEKLEQINEGVKTLQRFVLRSINTVGQLFIVALGVAGVGMFDEDAAKALAGLILLLMVIWDWDKLAPQAEEQKEKRA